MKLNINDDLINIVNHANGNLKLINYIKKESKAFVPGYIVFESIYIPCSLAVGMHIVPTLVTAILFPTIASIIEVFTFKSLETFINRRFDNMYKNKYLDDLDKISSSLNKLNVRTNRYLL